MFELCPPGSFVLCANAAFQEEAVRELRDVARLVRDAVQGLGVCALILTGSFARGEGTLVADPRTGTRWLSDMECLVVCGSRRGGRLGELCRVLRRIEARRNNDPASWRRGIKLELSAIPARRFARLRPAIFTRELFEHGKLLWGESGVLCAPRWWRTGTGIPFRDAIRLMNNRIMEQVGALVAHETGVCEPVPLAYKIHKFWIDIVTSLSLFLGCYRSTYEQRQESVESFLGGSPDVLGAAATRLLIARAREAMAVKRGTLPCTCDCPGQSLREAARVAALVWDWEGRRLLGSDCPSFNWNSIVTRLRRLETAGQRARDWARLLIRPTRRRYLKAPLLRAALRAGSFVNVIYAAGCLLDFFWDEVASDDEPGARISASLAQLLCIARGSGAAHRRVLAKNAVAAWQRHLRFAAA